MENTEYRKALIALQLKAEREAIRLAHRGNEPRHTVTGDYKYEDHLSGHACDASLR